MTVLKRIAMTLSVTLLLIAAGCAALGVAAEAIPPRPVGARYLLIDKQFAVMVWADRGLRLDWPRLRQDLAAGIVARIDAARQARIESVKNSSLAIPVESVVRFQADNPTLEFRPIEEVAQKLGVPVLIYIEVHHLSTRTPHSTAMYRGSARASVRVVEVHDGQAKTVYQEDDITVTFPKGSTEDGSPSGNDARYYVGTLQTLADELAKRFIDHPAED